MTGAIVRVCSASALVFLICGSAAFAQEVSKIKVGMIVPLTGMTADYGAAVRNSVELALENHPELRSKLEFVYEDAQYDPKLAVMALYKLRNVDRADLTFVWGLGQCKAAALLAQQLEMPLIA